MESLTGLLCGVTSNVLIAKDIHANIIVKCICIKNYVGGILVLLVRSSTIQFVLIIYVQIGRKHLQILCL